MPKSYLYTNSNADRHNKDGNSKFMKDTKRAVDVTINFHGKHFWRQNWQDSKHVYNVQHGYGGDYSSHKSF